MTPIAPLIKLARDGRLLPALRGAALLDPFYQVAWLAAAERAGVLVRLAASPMRRGELGALHGADAAMREAWEAWLAVGVRVGLLSFDGERYALSGLALALTKPGNDATLALIEEAASLHYRLITDTPGKLARGELWQLSDQDDALTVRSSRVLEPFELEALDRTLPSAGNVRLLDVGCGEGHSLRHAAQRNADLTALGLELQPEVAARAIRNVKAWGLQSRIAVEAVDVRAREPVAGFDIATLNNNIYYFPLGERVCVLAHVRNFLRPGGRLLITTACRGGSAGMTVLNLWAAATEGAGRLPDVDELQGQLTEAGFADVRTLRLIPAQAYFAFMATYHGESPSREVTS
jgi:SAM-dependent methyltransferase